MKRKSNRKGESTKKIWVQDSRIVAAVTSPDELTGQQTPDFYHKSTVLDVNQLFEVPRGTRKHVKAIAALRFLWFLCGIREFLPKLRHIAALA
ncbi:hypothetical protein [Roseibium algae]|uniref:Transposase n=1 Tax=Roseibium algae TaxID=3123038 RepID=A0ABU8TH83_9HYPH